MLMNGHELEPRLELHLERLLERVFCVYLSGISSIVSYLEVSVVCVCVCV